MYHYHEKNETEEVGMELLLIEYARIKDPDKLILKGNLTDADK